MSIKKKLGPTASTKMRSMLAVSKPAKIKWGINTGKSYGDVKTTLGCKESLLKRSRRTQITRSTYQQCVEVQTLAWLKSGFSEHHVFQALKIPERQVTSIQSGETTGRSSSPTHRKLLNSLRRQAKSRGKKLRRVRTTMDS
ncbi:uncharacterized protein IUM83_16463 [Phytophthora cinnamomi]|uniref:uncharacterized protein n=1 Tax=Phytophthora cinnamomi TaxID=4785 RepID=UPI00355A4B6D|nr:hypothetical protein IUM83_16463 [Phytophthora cinnamomi]